MNHIVITSAIPSNYSALTVLHLLAACSWELIDDDDDNNNNNNEKSAQRDANTAGALAVRPPARPPAVTNPQTRPITIHCAELALSVIIITISTTSSGEP